MMSNAAVARLMDLVPERSVRLQSGTVFVPTGASCACPDRFTLLCGFLRWLSPLEFLSREDQQKLGLIGAPKPAESEAEWDVEEPVS